MKAKGGSKATSKAVCLSVRTAGQVLLFCASSLLRAYLRKMGGPVDMVSNKSLLFACRGLKITFPTNVCIAGSTNPTF